MIRLGQEVVDLLGNEGLAARLFGSAAVSLKIVACGEHADRIIKDIDIVVPSRCVREAVGILRGEEWLVDKRSLMFSDARRVNLFWPQSSVHLDIFSDPLIFNHKVLLGDRIYLDQPTLSLADLLLTKLQIVKFSVQDAQDVGALLKAGCRTHELGNLSQRLSECCRKDWGLYYTCMTNLGQLLRSGSVSQEIADISSSLAAALVSARKTFYWQLRSVVGTRVRWYYEVD